jgi:hypothetical protein
VQFGTQHHSLHNFSSGCGFYLDGWLFAVKFSRYDD